MEYIVGIVDVSRLLHSFMSLICEVLFMINFIFLILIQKVSFFIFILLKTLFFLDATYNRFGNCYICII